MDGWIFGLTALLMLVSTAACLRFAFRHRHRPEYRVARTARVAASISCALASLTAIPTVADAVNGIARHDEISALVSAVAGLVFFACLQVMILDWTHARVSLSAAIWRRVAAVSAVIVLLVWEYQRVDTGLVDLTPEYATTSEVQLYLLTYLTFAAAAGVEISANSTRLALVVHRRRRVAASGLAVAAAGGTFILGFVLSRGGYVIAASLGLAWPLTLENIISPALAGLAFACVAVGFTLTTLVYDAQPLAAHGAA